MFEFEKASIREIHSAIKSDQVSIPEVVEHFIHRQQEVNPLLNALVEERWSAARSEARALQKAKSGLKEIPTLYGLPFTVKEMISVKGFRQTLGSIHRRDHRAPFTATVAERILDQKAILLGTTNVPELGFWFETDNAVYGTTRNPVDPRRTPGGSSGGEAALLGAGASVFGVGSDVGGSLRIPASFCGIYAHKPSPKMIPFTGHFPMLSDFEKYKGHRYPLTVMGPMARRAGDLRILLEIMMGPDGKDPETQKVKLGPPVEDWTGSTIWVLESPLIAGAASANESAQEAVRLCAQYFENLGAQVKPLKRDLFKNALQWWGAVHSEILREESFEELLFQGDRASVLGEIFKGAVGLQKYTFPALGTVLLERWRKGNARLLESQRQSADQELAILKEKLEALLAPQDLLIMPTFPSEAPKLGGTYLRPFDFAFTAVFNALGFPVTAAPVLKTSEGLPVGVQLAAGPLRDATCLSAAETLELAFGS